MLNLPAQIWPSYRNSGTSVAPHARSMKQDGSRGLPQLSINKVTFFRGSSHWHENGAGLIVIPNACTWDDIRTAGLETRTFENLVSVAMANYPGRGSGNSQAYTCVAWDDNGQPQNTLVASAGDQEQLLLASFDLNAVRASELLRIVTDWAKAQEDIRGLALVGSHARNSARPDSDVDLILLAKNPNGFRDTAWLAGVEWSRASVHLTKWHDEEYGTVWCRRTWFKPECEVEFASPLYHGRTSHRLI